MASKVYNVGKHRVANGNMDLDGDDMRLFLVMTNTTADTDQDAITQTSDFGTLDECDGANYVRKALANEAVNRDDANDRAEFDADDVVWTALGNGTRQIQGAVIHEFITNDAGSFPFCWIEFGATVNPGGANFSIVFNAEGIAQLS